MPIRVSVGFKAWLDTTDDRRPLSDYRTVLEGTIIQIAQLEEGIEHIKAWASQPRLANMDERQVLDAVIRMCDDIIRG